MSAIAVYHEVRRQLEEHIGSGIDESTLERVVLMVTGIVKAQSASPAQVSRALEELRLTGAKAESLERRIRRLDNDPEMTASLCFHPLARVHLRYGQPSELLLILDPTTQEDKLVMVSVAVWYRGRALPLAWAIWPANEPLEGEGFWKRIEKLLDEVATLLPVRVTITVMADRAFGCPAFIDLVVKHHWHYVVRVQGQTHYQDRQGQEDTVQSLVPFRRQRAKLRGKVFKKNGWRDASVVAYWGRRHQTPLCLVTDLKPCWSVLALYRRRFPIEATFRDYKSYGWRWEQGQVKNLQHVERLLVAMALATWFVLLAGTWKAQQILACPSSGRRRTRAWDGKLSLFSHGLHQLGLWLANDPLPVFPWRLSDWSAPNWSQQLYAHHAFAFIFA